MQRYVGLLVLLVALVSLFAGCASVEVVDRLNGQQLTTTSDKPIAHLAGDIWGYYLFGCIPLFTGDPDDENGMSWFTDTVKTENAVNMVTRKSAELGASKTTDMQSFSASTGINTLWLVWYREVQVSANAVK